MTPGVMIVGLIGFIALTGMSCILIDNFMVKNNKLTIKRQNTVKTNITHTNTSNSFISDLEECSVILDNTK